MKKPENIDIKSIVVQERLIWGLGNDNMVYLWNPHDHIWDLWASDPSL